jgi:hypothetical protein
METLSSKLNVGRDLSDELTETSSTEDQALSETSLPEDEDLDPPSLPPQ